MFFFNFSLTYNFSSGNLDPRTIASFLFFPIICDLRRSLTYQSLSKSLGTFSSLYFILFLFGAMATGFLSRTKEQTQVELNVRNCGNLLIFFILWSFLKFDVLSQVNKTADPFDDLFLCEHVLFSISFLNKPFNFIIQNQSLIHLLTWRPEIVLNQWIFKHIIEGKGHAYSHPRLVSSSKLVIMLCWLC
jgi:hypothetical protein